MTEKKELTEEEKQRVEDLKIKADLMNSTGNLFGCVAVLIVAVMFLGYLISKM